MIVRRLVGLVLALCVAADVSAAVTINIPAGSGIVAQQQLDPSFVEHVPLANFISWELIMRNPTMALTFTGGTAQFYDEDGTPILGAMNITPMQFQAVAVEFRAPGLSLPNCGDGVVDPGEPCDDGNMDNNDACTNGCMVSISLGPDGAVVPINSNIGVPFPFETIPHNVVPATVDMVLCFKEFEGPGGECDDPLAVLNVRLVEYTSRPGQSYVYPLNNPSVNPGGILFTGSGGGHEIGSNHRFASLNQRHAYDVGVLVGGTDCAAPCNTNASFFIYGDPVIAMADGEIVMADGGHPENPMPGVVDPNAGLPCRSQRCDGMTPACMPGQFGGSGNALTVRHDKADGTAEFSILAHMSSFAPGIQCGSIVQRGDVIGFVGNAGTSSAPHLHFSLNNNPAPEDPGTIDFPMYFNNIQYASPGGTPKRQLDVAMPSGTQWTVLAAPIPLAQNPPSLAGNVAEVEPNDTLAQHQSLTLPTTVTGMAEAGDVGDMAVRGDGIEDVYRTDLAAADSLAFDLSTPSATQNLDLYVLTEDLRVLNETHQGVAQSGPERVCLELDAGAYYAFVSNVDGPGKTEDAPYSLTISSDPQTVACAVTNAVQPIVVDAACQGEVEFTLTLHDNCCLDPETLNLQVTASNPTANATLGAVQLDMPVAVGPRDVSVTGRVAVSDLTSCPAVVEVQASASDCTGHSVSTTAQNTGCSVALVDTTPPTVMSTLATGTLWPPNHNLADVGLMTQVDDNCDPNAAASLVQQAWSDEPELGAPGAGRTAPDADFSGGLRLRRERQGGGDGRVYLVIGKVTDACANTNFACVTAGVPHSQGPAKLASLASQTAAAQAFCQANQGTAPLDFTLLGVSAPVGPKQ